MLYSTSELLKYKVSGVDGEIGKITDFYFDDREWSIRYAVVNINSWLPGGKVLISSHVFEQLDAENKKFHVDLTKEQIKNSPDIDTDKPVSRKKQELLHGYYQWPLYWGSAQNSVGASGAPVGIFPIRTIKEAQPQDQETQMLEKELDESHLRSFKEIESYNISTATGERGKASDFIVQQDSWMIQFMVMDTAKLFSSKQVLIPIDWIKWVSWIENKVSIWPTKEYLDSCPTFDIEYPIDKKNEADLHKYYDSSKEW